MGRVRIGSLLALLVCVGAAGQELEALNEEQLRKRVAVHLDHKRVEQALAAADQWSAVAPRNPEAWAMRGRLRTALGQLEQAEADLSRLVAMDPGRAQAWADRAALRQRLGQHEAAVEDTTRALDLDDGLALAAYVRGLARQALGKHEAAVVDLTRAIAVSPPHPRARYARGKSLQALGATERAQADEAAALELDARASSPWPQAQPKGRDDGHADLSHVRVGQRYRFALRNNMRSTWTVLEVGQDRVRYTMSMEMDMGEGYRQVGEPTEQVWSYVPPEPGGPLPTPPAEGKRESLVVDGVEFDCLVVNSKAGGVVSQSWCPMSPGSDTVPTFPGVVKYLSDGSPTMVLGGIEQPTGR